MILTVPVFMDDGFDNLIKKNLPSSMISISLLNLDMRFVSRVQKLLSHVRRRRKLHIPEKPSENSVRAPMIDIYIYAYIYTHTYIHVGETRYSRRKHSDKLVLFVSIPIIPGAMHITRMPKLGSYTSSKNIPLSCLVFYL